jgi:serine/threonine protein kinase
MHRDLKPENILCRSKEKTYDIVLADFGLATFKNDPKILFKRCGTPGFVAPEILNYDVFYFYLKIKNRKEKKCIVRHVMFFRLESYFICF